jgi:hypothetical protein
MPEPPAQLVADLSAAELNSIHDWWSGLPEESRLEIATLWDERQDNCFFGVTTTGPGETLPRVIGGNFVPRDDAAGWNEWRREYFNYLFNHPELSYAVPMVVRTFHIGCHKHPRVRAILESGRVPVGFRCLIDSPKCPFIDAPALRPRDKTATPPP